MLMDWENILMTLTSAGLFGLIGFVWKFSHQVTKMQQSLTDIERRVRNIEGDLDKAQDRMYSMVKSRTEFMQK
ncbi:MAG: hypothetical protein Unbinned97contig1000_19 [Prokaryotic dsDNA virus sp.]|nr:MAG: hypothetical protein Unbinned97contig1000_19 [Prokaryotic dsDNA virus sp.]|tara:strand:- start:4145 stop:4363 length:219 start_codon:yes stop_codon:yes gene_type:complete